jgi:hypothetical protein
LVVARSDFDREACVKTVAALTFIFLFAFAAVAQRAENNTDEQLAARNAPDVFIYSASAFGPDKNRDSNFTIEVGNTGTKTITVIEWEYYFSRDGDRDKPDTETFRETRLSLQPGARTKLTQHVHRYTDKFVTNFRLSTVRIMRVEYEDGSSWRRPAASK